MIDPEVKMLMEKLTENIETVQDAISQINSLVDNILVQNIVLKGFLTHYFITRPDGKADLRLFTDLQLAGLRTFQKEGKLSEKQLRDFENLYEEINEAVRENGYAGYLDEPMDDGPVH